VVGGVIHVYIEVAGDEEFMRCGCSCGEKRRNSSKKLEKGSENMEDVGGR